MNRMCIGGMEASRISLGCMRIDKLSNKEAQALLNTALEKGINFLTMRTFMPAENPSVFFPRR